MTAADLDRLLAGCLAGLTVEQRLYVLPRVAGALPDAALRRARPADAGWGWPSEAAERCHRPGAWGWFAGLLAGMAREAHAAGRPATARSCLGLSGQVTPGWWWLGGPVEARRPAEARP